MEESDYDNSCCNSGTSLRNSLRSSCSSGHCKAGTGLQFGRLTPTKRKRTKSAKSLKKKVLLHNNNTIIYDKKDFYSTEESEEEEEFDKTFSLCSEPKRFQTEEDFIKPSKDHYCDKSDFDNSYYNRGFHELIATFAKKLHLIESDPIHEQYVSYSQQNQSQKDLSKTGYTYAQSFSYNKYIDPLKAFVWDIPNMSRKTISSAKSVVMTTSSSTVTKSEFSNDSKSSSIKSMQTLQNSTPKASTPVPESRRTPTRNPSAQMFTRSHCLGGAQCEAPGCLIHNKKKKKRSPKTGVVIPNSGQGIEPEFEFSEEEEHNDYRLNNQLNYQRLNNYRQNGYPYENDDYESEEEDEEITVIRRVTKIFRTTINNTISNTSRIIDSITPGPVKRAANSCPSLWLFLSIILFLVPLVYVMSQYKSSLWSESSLEALAGADMSSNYKINQLIKEINDLKSDLNALKGSNIEIKHQMGNNDFDGNEKIKVLNNKIDSIEDYLNNIMKNCCRNETDSILALIDWRLSAFMASMLTQNQNRDQTMTASEAAQELKEFIRLELSKTNDNFKESFERKLMSTIERVETQMNQKSDHFSSNISIDEIKSLISEALAIYDADKTGQPDFALEPAGGTVINTRCSETFDPYGVQYKIFGMPVWSSSISPRAVIQPSISPGECWAFKGSNGYLVVKLSQPIIPSGFSYEHIPKQISRDGNIDSAPKEFQVRGLDDESDTSGHLLGNYIYEDNGRPMQYFEVQDPNPRVFQIIELVILSNHGHNDYTCLYRFRVHGKRVGH